MQPVITEVGTSHHLYNGEPDGARCELYGGQTHLELAVFLSDLKEAELHPLKICLGFLVYRLSIFFVVQMDNTYFDMPYAHPANVAIPPMFPRGYGMPCSLAICDEHGICRSLVFRTLTNGFSNTVIGAIEHQAAEGLTPTHHGETIAAAYGVWRTPKKMFQATTTRDGALIPALMEISR